MGYMVVYNNFITLLNLPITSFLCPPQLQFNLFYWLMCEMIYKLGAVKLLWIFVVIVGL